MTQSSLDFRGLQSSNRMKTFGLLAGMGALVWLVVFAAMTYMGKSSAMIVPVAVGFALISVWGVVLLLGFTCYHNDRCKNY